MNENRVIFYSLLLILFSLISVESALKTIKRIQKTRSGIEALEEALQEIDIEEEDQDLGVTRKTRVEFQQNYFDCVNINSEIEKLTTNFSIISEENCNTVYRFAAFRILYDVTLKNGSTTQLSIQLELQNSEIQTDQTIVTLTGKVVDGYLSGALFQSVVVYPPISDPNICQSEPGITQLQSTSASATLILLPNNPSTPTPEQNDYFSVRALRLPEAFDCFGSASVNYSPGLIYLQ